MNIIELTKRDVIAASSAIQLDSIKMGLQLSSADAAALRIFERKVRKICGPLQVGDDIHIRSNNKLYELLWVPKVGNVGTVTHV